MCLIKWFSQLRIGSVFFPVTTLAVEIWLNSYTSQGNHSGILARIPFHSGEGHRKSTNQSSKNVMLFKDMKLFSYPQVCLPYHYLSFVADSVNYSFHSLLSINTLINYIWAGSDTCLRNETELQVITVEDDSETLPACYIKSWIFMVIGIHFSYTLHLHSFCIKTLPKNTTKL